MLHRIAVVIDNNDSTIDVLHTFTIENNSTTVDCFTSYMYYRLQLLNSLSAAHNRYR